MTGTASPVTAGAFGSPPTAIVSSEPVPLTTTSSAAASGAPSSTVTWPTSVPASLSIVTVSAPPPGATSTVSTPVASSVTPPTSRVTLSRAAARRELDLLGGAAAVELERVGTALAVDRVAAVARVPDERVVVAPSCTVSSPRLPSITSSSVSPISVSAPEPPVIVSLPWPPLIVVGVVPSTSPFESSIRTTSSPARASRSIAPTSARAKLNSARAVVAEVDLDRGRIARLQAERDVLVVEVAVDLEHAARVDLGRLADGVVSE